MGYKMIFAPDRKGYGSLVLYDENKIIINLKSRSGSINTKGELVNCIPGNSYLMKCFPEVPVAAEYSKMYIDSAPGFGWKWRIDGHLLVHPDGGAPGTAGCIGIQQSNGMELYYFAMWYFGRGRHPIPLEVHKL